MHKVIADCRFPSLFLRSSEIKMLNKYFFSCNVQSSEGSSQQSAYAVYVLHSTSIWNRDGLYMSSLQYDIMCVELLLRMMLCCTFGFQERTSGTLSNVTAPRSLCSGVQRPRTSLSSQTATSPSILLHHVGHCGKARFLTPCGLLCSLSPDHKDFFPLQANSWATKF